MKSKLRKKLTKLNWNFIGGDYIKELIELADEVLFFNREGVLSDHFKKQEQGTEFAVIYIQDLPMSQQPDRWFLETFASMKFNAARAKQLIGLHIYPTLTSIE